MTQPPQIAGKGGRTKRAFSDEEIHKIDEMAQNNCHMDTIALALDIPLTTLVRRFGREIKQKRAKGRTELRNNQAKLAKTQAAMAIFLGKNVLGQIDKVEHIEKTEPIKPLTVAERAIVQEAASKILLLKLNEPKAQESA